MAANFDLTNLAVTGLAPGNELIYDNAGMPSIMVKIPKMTYKQLGMGESAAVHPAFIVNGQISIHALREEGDWFSEGDGL